jgi:hypothetical protein
MNENGRGVEGEGVNEIEEKDCWTFLRHFNLLFFCVFFFVEQKRKLI